MTWAEYKAKNAHLPQVQQYTIENEGNFYYRIWKNFNHTGNCFYRKYGKFKAAQ